MSSDQNKITGPEDPSIPYDVYAKKSSKLYAQRFSDMVKTGTRDDGRKFTDTRKLFIKHGVVVGARGSVYLEQGESKIIASIFEPQDIPNQPDYSVDGEIDCDFQYAPFGCFKRKICQQDDEEAHYGTIIKNAIECLVSLPDVANLILEVNILVLEDDGSCLSGAILCAALCLGDAGLPIFDIPTSLTVAVQDDVILVEPTLYEENLCSEALKNECDHGVVVVTMTHHHRQIQHYYQTGIMSTDKLVRALKVLEEASKKCLPLFRRDILIQSVGKKFRLLRKRPV